MLTLEIAERSYKLNILTLEIAETSNKLNIHPTKYKNARGS